MIGEMGKRPEWPPSAAVDRARRERTLWWSLVLVETVMLAESLLCSAGAVWATLYPNGVVPVAFAPPLAVAPFLFSGGIFVALVAELGMGVSLARLRREIGNPYRLMALLVVVSAVIQSAAAALFWVLFSRSLSGLSF